MHFSRDVASIIAMCSLVVPAWPRQTGDQRPTLSVETRLITLPVTVVDNKGRLVTGLTREAFTVYDNGQPQAIAFFASDDLPATVGLVIDSSSSMRGRREQVTAAGAAFAAISHPLDELFTMNFNERAWPGLPPQVAFARDREQLCAALSAAPVEGMTALYDAIDRALDHLVLATRDRKALIVVSDGGDNASTHTLDEVIAHAHFREVVIHAVALFEHDSRDARPQVMKRLARETGGSLFTPNRADEIVASFAQIAREIRSAYTIGYAPPDTPNGDFRTVRVVAVVGGREIDARTRAGYYAGRTQDTVR
jgi:Ca-activated chloride channel family protein